MREAERRLENAQTQSSSIVSDARSQAAGIIREANEQALQSGGRLLSAYKASNGRRFLIITEADRSVTTFLLPEEY